MSAGKFDRRITVQARTVTEDAFGGVIDGWNDFVTVWAQYQPGTGGERRVAAAQEQGQMPATFNIRYSITAAGITPQSHRIVFSGSNWDIESIAETARGKELSIVARRVL